MVCKMVWGSRTLRCVAPRPLPSCHLASSFSASHPPVFLLMWKISSAVPALLSGRPGCHGNCILLGLG